jgi:hypothetical protein
MYKNNYQTAPKNYYQMVKEEMENEYIKEMVISQLDAMYFEGFAESLSSEEFEFYFNQYKEDFC